MIIPCLVTGDIKLCSATYRLFKVAAKDTKCNAYKVLYKGVLVKVVSCFHFFHLRYNTRLPYSVQPSLQHYFFGMVHIDMHKRVLIISELLSCVTASISSSVTNGH